MTLTLSCPYGCKLPVVNREDDARRVIMNHHRTRHGAKLAPDANDLFHRAHPVLHTDYFGDVPNPRHS
jgi:hypothetical protein